MGFLLFFLIIKLNNIFFLQILLQDKYNIGVLTVNIECMWLGTKWMERLAESSSFIRFYASPHTFYIYRQYTNIVYVSVSLFLSRNVISCYVSLQQHDKYVFKHHRFDNAS
jgi:hypothetical protein